MEGIYLTNNKKLYNWILQKIGKWLEFSRYHKERVNYICNRCKKHYPYGKYLNVHHKYYIEARDPWDYPDEAIEVLCQRCHKKIDHSLIKKIPCSYRNELMEKPFILTPRFVFKKYTKDNNGKLISACCDIKYKKFFDIRYFGYIVDCGYITGKNQGDGRFDYVLILRELSTGEKIFSGRKLGSPKNGFTGRLDINFFKE